MWFLRWQLPGWRYFSGVILTYARMKDLVFIAGSFSFANVAIANTCHLNVGLSDCIQLRQFHPHGGDVPQGAITARNFLRLFNIRDNKKHYLLFGVHSSALKALFCFFSHKFAIFSACYLHIFVKIVSLLLELKPDIML